MKKILKLIHGKYGANQQYISCATILAHLLKSNMAPTFLISMKEKTF